MRTVEKKKLRPKYKLFRPRIRSRHPSHATLRSRNGKKLKLLPFKSVVRFGSSYVAKDSIENGGNRVELNSVESIKNSSNKALMKKCFERDNVTTADWWMITNTTEGYRFQKGTNSDIITIEELSYPLVTKHIFGSRGTGNKKHDNVESLTQWLSNKTNLDNYIIEKYYSYNREYRLHVTENGCFYTCRKMLRTDTPDNQRWYRNNDNSVWLLENNPGFDKPVNWDNIVEECVKALKSVGLDFGAVDLRIQSATNKNDEPRENPKFIIIEINSAPSFGDITMVKYIDEIPKLLTAKWEKLKEENLVLQ